MDRAMFIHNTLRDFVSHHAFWITEALSAVIAYAVYHKAVHQK